ncbi:MAG: hypothetical protein ACOC3X_01940 [Nanoarchaeota archaeon]
MNLSNFKKANKNISSYFTKKIIFISSFFIILFFIFFFALIKPSIVGYSVYKEMSSNEVPMNSYILSINELNEELLKKNTNLSVCYNLSNDLFFTLNQKLNNSINCFKSLSNCSFELRMKTQQINTLNDLNKENELTFQNEISNIKKEHKNELSDLNYELKKIKQEYDKIIQNSANNICCKAKVDNNLIDSYSLVNDKIVCKTNGNFTITC